MALSATLVLAIMIVRHVGSFGSTGWQPPEAPRLEGLYAPNQKLLEAELLGRGDVYGPEDIAIDSDGLIYGGTQDGKIIRINQDDSVEVFAQTGGRPLGLHFDSTGNLIVCDAYQGLLSINKFGEVSQLVSEVDGVPLVFTNDIDIASDGKIYFTDASSRWNQANYMSDLYQTRPYGRFMVYDPSSDEVEVLLDELYFANGVALSESEDFVLVNETWRYRILRYWLKGSRAGSFDVFVDNLPGFPDGISSDRKGVFWLALPTPRNSIIDRLHPYPWAKNLLAALPAWLAPKPIEYGFVLGFDEAGNLLYNLQDPAGDHLKEVTSVQAHNGQLYLGTLGNDRVGRLSLSQ